VICVECISSSPSLPIQLFILASPEGTLLLADRLKSSRCSPGKACTHGRDVPRPRSLMIQTAGQFQKRSRIPGIILAFGMNVN